jgi:hypothetical protein
MIVYLLSPLWSLLTDAFPKTTINNTHRELPRVSFSNIPARPAQEERVPGGSKIGDRGALHYTIYWDTDRGVFCMTSFLRNFENHFPSDGPFCDHPSHPAEVEHSFRETLLPQCSWSRCTCAVSRRSDYHYRYHGKSGHVSGRPPRLNLDRIILTKSEIGGVSSQAEQ